jgi:hypothetical protein
VLSFPLLGIQCAVAYILAIYLRFRVPPEITIEERHRMIRQQEHIHKLASQRETARLKKRQVGQEKDEKVNEKGKDEDANDFEGAMKDDPKKKIDESASAKKRQRSKSGIGGDETDLSPDLIEEEVIWMVVLFTFSFETHFIPFIPLNIVTRILSRNIGRR